MKVIPAGLLALGVVLIAPPASADLIIGDPDNSWIRYELAGTIPSFPPPHPIPLPVVQDYSSPVVTAEVDRTGAGGGALSWVVNAVPADGILRALVSVSSGLICAPEGCVINPEQAVMALYLADRVFIDQVFTDPITLTVRLAVDGNVSGPEDSNTQVISHLKAFIDPFGDGLSFDAFNSQEMGAMDFILEESVTLHPGQQWFDIDALLHLNVVSTYQELGVFTTADFLSTAVLDIVVPSGITFHSEAGFTNDSIILPEPTTIALFGAGLVGLRLIARRRKAA